MELKRFKIHRVFVVFDTANFGIAPIPSKYRASAADTNSDAFNLETGEQCVNIIMMNHHQFSYC